MKSWKRLERLAAWGRAAVTGQYDSGWFQKRAQFGGYTDVFGGKKKVIGITCGQSQETLHRWAGLASQGGYWGRSQHLNFGLLLGNY